MMKNIESEQSKAKQKALKDVSIAFANFLDTDCIRSVFGWCLIECLEKYQGYEFQLDELYDYWRDRILRENSI